MSTDSAHFKSQISKLIQSGGFLGSLLSKLPGPLMKVAVPLAKTILALLGITADASAEFERNSKRTQNKIHHSGPPLSTTLIISNKEMNDIMKKVQALEDPNILLKGVTKTIKKERKEQKGVFLSMLLGTLGASLLGNIFSGKRNCKSWFSE